MSNCPSVNLIFYKLIFISKVSSYYNIYPFIVLIQVVLLCRTVLENYPNVASELNSPVYKAFILVLLSTSKAVRSVALEEVKGLVGNKDRALLARYLVLKLNEVLEEGKLLSGKEKSPPDEKGSEVTGKMVLDCVQALCSFRGEFFLIHL